MLGLAARLERLFCRVRLWQPHEKTAASCQRSRSQQGPLPDRVESVSSSEDDRSRFRDRDKERHRGRPVHQDPCSFDLHNFLSWLTKRVHIQSSLASRRLQNTILARLPGFGSRPQRRPSLPAAHGCPQRRARVPSVTRMQWRRASLSSAEMEAKHKDSATPLMKCFLVLPVGESGVCRVCNTTRKEDPFDVTRQ